MHTHNSRKRTRSRSCDRSHRRHRTRYRSRERSRAKSRSPVVRTRSRTRSLVTPPRSSTTRTPDVPRTCHENLVARDRTLDTILSRLESIEHKFTSTPVPPSEPSASSTTQAIVDAIQSINPIRTHNYYVSNFDPAIHDIDAWCDEVDRARKANRWEDKECLSRVANCLKGDAKTWLNEWVTADRCWTSFKREFQPLCPRKLDYANILFDAMSSTSNKYQTYAEYARRTLLRLRIVKGLSDELMTQIVIRGIDDAQVRAVAANANLTSENLVSFLSIHVKPKPDKPAAKTSNYPPPRKRPAEHAGSSLKCFHCGQNGHKAFNCSKRPKPSLSTSVPQPQVICAFCKKPGHTDSACFAKQRA